VGDIADDAASTETSDAAGAGAPHRHPNLASARLTTLVFGCMNVHLAARKIDDINASP